MKILRAFKTELDLNNKQRTACVRQAGMARFAYHMGLARVQAALANDEKSPTTIDLHRTRSWQTDRLMADRPAARVDLGINRMAQVSDGTCFENPRALKSSLTRLKRLQRVVSRRQKGSSNRQKAVRQLARAHFRVGNIRKDALYQATTFLTTMVPPTRAGETKSAIVLET